MTFKKLYLKSGNAFWNPVNRIWTKHYQLDLGKMEFCEYKPLSLYTSVEP